MIRRPPRSTQSRSSAASDVYKRQLAVRVEADEHELAVRRDQHLAILLEVAAYLLALGDHACVVADRFRLDSAASGELAAERLRPALRELARREQPAVGDAGAGVLQLSLIHISEPTRLGMISYAVFCLKKKK